MTKTCQRCGKPFEAYHLNRQRFCSKACQRKEWRGPRRKWERAPATATCETCRKEFKPRSDKSRFCSRPCLYVSLSGPTSPSWKGGRVSLSGYVGIYAPDHPSVQHLASGKRYVLEHRLVMEKILGRPIERHETIHHINGDRTDNRVENLQLRSGRHGKGVHHRCVDCGSMNIRTEKI